MCKVAAFALLAVATSGLNGCAATSDDEDLDDAAGDDGALQAAPLEAPGPGEIVFGRDVEERRDIVPLTKNGAPRVLYSLKVEDLRPEEKLAVRAEATISQCNPSDTGCKPYGYGPKLTLAIVLAGGPNDTSGALLGRDVIDGCSENEHHCTLVIKEQITQGRSGTKYVNVVATATDDRAGKDDLTLVEKHHGGLYVTRMAPGSDVQGKQEMLDLIARQRLDIDNVDNNSGGSRRTPHVTFRAKITADPGDIVDISGVIKAKLHGSSCDPLIANEVFVSKKADNKPWDSKVAVLTANNGTNCVNSPCKLHKSGADQLPNSLSPNTTLYVSVVSRAGRSCTQPGDQWEIDNSDSEFKVRVRHAK